MSETTCISIEQYDEAEKLGKIDLSFSEIMAFSPTTFAALGFPTHVSCEPELVRYADWNRDTANQEYFKPNQFLRGPSVETTFTQDEADLISWVCDQVEEMTGKLMGRSVRPLCSPLAAIGLFRIIQTLQELFNQQSFSIFEIGPGSGYLGAMLIRAGHSYASIDNTQAFYLWQNRLFPHIAGSSDFAEWALEKPGTFGPLTRVTNIPWWTYLRFGLDCPIKADIIVSNANLGEMRYDALLFSLAVARRMLDESDVKLFLFSSVGYPRENTEESIKAEFSRAGFDKVWERLFYGYAPRGFTPPRTVVRRLERQIPLYNPSGRKERLAASDFMRMPAACHPLDLDFVRTIEGWIPPVPDRDGQTSSEMLPGPRQDLIAMKARAVMSDYHPRWKRYLSPRFVLGKVRDRGLVWCARVLLAKIYGWLRSYPKKIYRQSQHYLNLPTTLLKNARSVIWPSAAYTDSVLAIYDFRASPYTYDFAQFLANCEAYRVENSLSYIDVVIVVDREKRHRGDQPEVTESNYRNWILNLAECTDLLRSVSSLSIFDDKHKFLSFYHRARYTHKVFPNIGNPIVYEPRAEYGLRRVADFFQRTGYVPRFESSGVLLEWAERYFLQNSYPMLPVVVIVRNLKTRQPGRNIDWPEWLKFFESVRHEYPVKFFIVNDFWNPVVLPDEHRENACLSAEATISTKYRNALMQRALLIMGPSSGPFFSTAPFLDTPFLMCLDKASRYFSLDFQKEFHGFTDEWQFPWLSKYQKIVMGEDANFIRTEFTEMYALLERDQRLVPSYWPSPAPGTQTQTERLSG